ncbi:MAG: AbrB/MazE/SpoVT family DNA-binding domain-containing protein [Candidatus Omnitrophica bacterium]|nr:AbrB/MazE/SpoVT family DNA-binding domain-containing protein [Candidatus Omnitrophota bacterium]
MSAVTISPKFQVVIPKEIREVMHLKSGQKVEVICYDNRIQLIPIRPMKELQGFLKGMDTSFVREKKNRL